MADFRQQGITNWTPPYQNSVAEVAKNNPISSAMSLGIVPVAGAALGKLGNLASAMVTPDDRTLGQRVQQNVAPVAQRTAKDLEGYTTGMEGKLTRTQVTPFPAPEFNRQPLATHSTMNDPSTLFGSAPAMDTTPMGPPNVTGPWGGGKGPLAVLNGDNLGDTSAISRRVDWSPGSANARSVGTLDNRGRTYAEQVAHANAVNNAPLSLEQFRLAQQNGNTSWSLPREQQNAAALAGFNAQEKLREVNANTKANQNTALAHMYSADKQAETEKMKHMTPAALDPSVINKNNAESSMYGAHKENYDLTGRASALTALSKGKPKLGEMSAMGKNFDTRLGLMSKEDATKLLQNTMELMHPEEAKYFANIITQMK